MLGRDEGFKKVRGEGKCCHQRGRSRTHSLGLEEREKYEIFIILFGLEELRPSGSEP